MIPLVRDWLPHDVVSRDVVRQAVEEAVSAWSRRWFAKGRIGVSSLLPCPVEARGDSEGGKWRVFQCGVGLDLSARTALRLVERALDAPISAIEPTEADRALLKGFEQRIVDDLVTTLAERLSLPQAPGGEPRQSRDPFAGAGGLIVRLSEGSGSDLASVALPFAALLPLCRASFGPPPLPRGGLDSLTGALKGVPLAVEATLGRVHLGLRELQDLAPGDVLVLNKHLSDSLELTVAGARGVLARAELQNSDGSLALVLHD